MTYTPTPAEFLTLTEPEDDDTDEVLGIDPLVSIAESLRSIATTMGQPVAEAVAATAAREVIDGLEQDLADLEDKHRALYDLLAEVEKIVKPSTSKLANTVREAITRWRNPEVPVVDEPEPVADPAPGETPVAKRPQVEQPAHDAPVEEWRTYARFLGHGRTGPAFNELEQMNRSQIRTLLGIPQL